MTKSEQLQKEHKEMFTRARKQNTVRVLKEELEEIEISLEECITDDGFIKDDYRERYSILVHKKSSFVDVIDWMEGK